MSKDNRRKRKHGSDDCVTEEEIELLNFFKEGKPSPQERISFNRPKSPQERISFNRPKSPQERISLDRPINFLIHTDPYDNEDCIEVQERVMNDFRFNDKNIYNTHGIVGDGSGYKTLKNSGKTSDVVYVLLHGKNIEGDNTNKYSQHHMTYITPDVSVESSNLLKKASQNSSDNATIVLQSCHGGRAATNIILKNKIDREQLKPGQTALFLGAAQKSTFSTHHNKYVSKVIADHKGKITPESLREIKNCYPETFSFIKDSKLTKCSRIKCDKEGNFIRATSEFVLYKKPNGSTYGKWREKKTETVELTSKSIEGILESNYVNFSSLRSSSKDHQKDKYLGYIKEYERTVNTIVDAINSGKIEEEKSILVTELILKNCLNICKYGLNTELPVSNKGFAVHMMDYVIKKTEGLEISDELSQELRADIAVTFNEAMSDNRVVGKVASFIESITRKASERIYSSPYLDYRDNTSFFDGIEFSSDPKNQSSLKKNFLSLDSSEPKLFSYERLANTKVYKGFLNALDLAEDSKKQNISKFTHGSRSFIKFCKNVGGREGSEGNLGGSINKAIVDSCSATINIISKALAPTSKALAPISKALAPISKALALAPTYDEDGNKISSGAFTRSVKFTENLLFDRNPDSVGGRIHHGIVDNMSSAGKGVLNALNLRTPSDPDSNGAIRDGIASVSQSIMSACGLGKKGGDVMDMPDNYLISNNDYLERYDLSDKGLSLFFNSTADLERIKKQLGITSEVSNYPGKYVNDPDMSLLLIFDKNCKIARPKYDSSVADSLPKPNTFYQIPTLNYHAPNLVDLLNKLENYELLVKESTKEGQGVDKDKIFLEPKEVIILNPDNFLGLQEVLKIKITSDEIKVYKERVKEALQFSHDWLSKIPENERDEETSDNIKLLGDILKKPKHALSALPNKIYKSIYTSYDKGICKVSREERGYQQLIFKEFKEFSADSKKELSKAVSMLHECIDIEKRIICKDPRLQEDGMPLLYSFDYTINSAIAIIDGLIKNKSTSDDEKEELESWKIAFDSAKEHYSQFNKNVVFNYLVAGGYELDCKKAKKLLDHTSEFKNLINFKGVNSQQVEQYIEYAWQKDFSRESNKSIHFMDVLKKINNENINLDSTKNNQNSFLKNLSSVPHNIKNTAKAKGAELAADAFYCVYNAGKSTIYKNELFVDKEIKEAIDKDKPSYLLSISYIADSIKTLRESTAEILALDKEVSEVLGELEQKTDECNLVYLEYRRCEFNLQELEEELEDLKNYKGSDSYNYKNKQISEVAEKGKKIYKKLSSMMPAVEQLEKRSQILINGYHKTDRLFDKKNHVFKLEDPVIKKLTKTTIVNGYEITYITPAERRRKELLDDINRANNIINGNPEFLNVIDISPEAERTRKMFDKINRTNDTKDQLLQDKPKPLTLLEQIQVNKTKQDLEDGPVALKQEKIPTRPKQSSQDDSNNEQTLLKIFEEIKRGKIRYEQNRNKSKNKSKNENHEVTPKHIFADICDSMQSKNDKTIPKGLFELFDDKDLVTLQQKLVSGYENLEVNRLRANLSDLGQSNMNNKDMIEPYEKMYKQFNEIGEFELAKIALYDAILRKQGRRYEKTTTFDINYNKATEHEEALLEEINGSVKNWRSFAVNLKKKLDYIVGDYFDEGRYSSAIDALKDLCNEIKGSSYYEKEQHEAIREISSSVMYYLALAYHNNKQYDMAALTAKESCENYPVKGGEFIYEKDGAVISLKKYNTVELLKKSLSKITSTNLQKSQYLEESAKRREIQIKSIREMEEHIKTSLPESDINNKIKAVKLGIGDSGYYNLEMINQLLASIRKIEDKKSPEDKKAIVADLSSVNKGKYEININDHQLNEFIKKDDAKSLIIPFYINEENLKHFLSFKLSYRSNKDGNFITVEVFDSANLPRKIVQKYVNNLQKFIVSKRSDLNKVEWNTFTLDSDQKGLQDGSLYGDCGPHMINNIKFMLGYPEASNHGIMSSLLRSTPEERMELGLSLRSKDLITIARENNLTKFDYYYLAEAYKLFNNNEFDKAIQYLARTEGCCNIPDEHAFEFYSLLGDCFYRLGEYENAEIEYKSAIKSYEQKSGQDISLKYTKLCLADTQFVLGKFDEAKETCEEILKSPINNNDEEVGKIISQVKTLLKDIEPNIKDSKANDNNDKQKDKSSGQVKNTAKNGYANPDDNGDDLLSTEIVPVKPKEPKQKPKEPEQKPKEPEQKPKPKKPEHKEIVQKPNKDNLVEEELGSPSKYFNLANDQLRSGTFEEDAYKNLINALKICPTDDKETIKRIKDLFDDNHEKKNSTHCNNFAAEFFRREEYKEAEKYFQLAINLGKEATANSKSLYHWNLAGTQLKLEKFEDAYKNLINALKICPKDDKEQIKMIKDLFDNNHKKKNSTHCNNFAAEFFKREEYEEAAKYFQLAILGKEATANSKSLYHWNLAGTQLKLEKFEDAYKNLINALKICPKDDKEQIKMIKDLFDDNHKKKNSTHCNNFAAEFFKREEYEEAEKYFQLAILGKEATANSKSLYHWNLAGTQLKLEKFEDAYKNLINALEICPKDDKEQIKMIKDLFDNNREKKNSTHCNNFAAEFFKREEYEEAAKYFQLAINLGKEDTKENQEIHRCNLKNAQTYLKEPKPEPKPEKVNQSTNANQSNLSQQNLPSDKNNQITSVTYNDLAGREAAQNAEYAKAAYYFNLVTKELEEKNLSEQEVKITKATVYYNLAAVQFELGEEECKNAFKSLTESLRNCTEDDQRKIDLTIKLFEKNNEKATSRDYGRFGSALYEHKQYEAAEKYLQLAINKCPEKSPDQLSVIYLNLSKAQSEQGKDDASRVSRHKSTLFKRIAEVVLPKDDNLPVLKSAKEAYKLGIELYKEKNKSLTPLFLMKAANLHSENSKKKNSQKEDLLTNRELFNIYFFSGDMLLSAGRYDSSCECYENALTYDKPTKNDLRNEKNQDTNISKFEELLGKLKTNHEKAKALLGKNKKEPESKNANPKTSPSSPNASKTNGNNNDRRNKT